MTGTFTIRIKEGYRVSIQAHVISHPRDYVIFIISLNPSEDVMETLKKD